MEDIEEVTILLDDVVGLSCNLLNVPKLLLALGLAESGGDAMRALADRVVRLDGELSPITVKLPALPARIVVQVGSGKKLAVIEANTDGHKNAQLARPVRRSSGKTSDLTGRPLPEPKQA